MQFYLILTVLSYAIALFQAQLRKRPLATCIPEAFNTNDTIADYNDYVYDSDTLLFCFREMVRSLDSPATVSAIQVINTLYEQGSPVYLFTNAPDIWADAVVQALDLNIPMQRRITSSFGVKMTSQALYDRVLKYVKDTDEVQKLVYIEDTFRNLTPVLHKPEWQPVLFEPELQNECEFTVNRLSDKACAWIGHAQVIQNLDEILL